MKQTRCGSIVVFGKDVHNSIGLTLEKIFKAMELSTDLNGEVIVVDDGSRPSLSDSIPIELREHLRFAREETSKGIGDALLTGCRLAKNESILFVPGHDFYSQEALNTALSLMDKSPVVIGYRTNLNERPLLKRISSLVFRNLIKIRTNRFIVDPHGLPTYPKSVVLKNLPRDSRHALHIYILRALNELNLTTIQFSAPINPHYAEALLNGPRSYIIYARNVWSVCRILFKPNWRKK
jgi:glycosyltransferase involved in cell wall biosynthesis